MPRAALAALVLLASGLLLACDDDADGEGTVPTAILEVEVRDGGLDPSEVRLQPPDRFQLVIHNESDSECLFNLGPWVRDWEVGAGETGEIDFQIPPEEPEGDVEMGCAGSSERRGTVTVLPGTVLD